MAGDLLLAGGLFLLALAGGALLTYVWLGFISTCPARLPRSATSPSASARPFC